MVRSYFFTAVVAAFGVSATDAAIAQDTVKIGIIMPMTGVLGPIGKQVTARVTLRAVNGRRFVFDVEVTNEDGVKIGEGLHERALINISRFAGVQR